jgi:hypothetical protein
VDRSFREGPPSNPMSSDEQLLNRYCQMILTKGQNESAAVDHDGSIVTRENEGQSVWVLPGTVNEREMRRNIAPNSKGKPRLFVVAASSHATPKEYEKVYGSPPPNLGALQTYAQAIHDLWDKEKSFIRYGPQGNEVEQKFSQLKQVTSYMSSIDINSQSYYAAAYGVSGPTEMVTIAFVKELDLPDGNSNPFKIIIDATAADSAKLKEAKYDIGVEYTVS